MYWSRIIDIAGVFIMTILAGLVGILAIVEGGKGTGIILAGAAACVIHARYAVGVPAVCARCRDSAVVAHRGSPRACSAYALRAAQADGDARRDMTGDHKHVSRCSIARLKALNT